MKYKLLFTIFLLALLLPSCVENSSDDLIDNSTAAVTYSTQVKNIIETNCLFCHSSPPANGAPMQLTTYNDVKNAILTQGLLDRISRPQGAPGMMPNGGSRLPQATINKLIAWQNGGFIE